MIFRSNWRTYSTSLFHDCCFSIVSQNSKSSYYSLLSNIEKILEKRRKKYKKLYTFLNNNNTIYDLQFGLKQQYPTFQAVINITEDIRKVLDDGSIGCRLIKSF